MNLQENIKRILNLMLVEKTNNEEIEEQESEATPDVETDTSSTGTETNTQTTGYPSVTKWESGRTFGKTYMNDPKYKWESGRTLGPTYKGPNGKWESGLKRGKANPLN